MSDSFVTVVIILIAAVLMFMVPMISVAHRKDVVANQTVQSAITEFVDTAREKGKITQSEFENLIAEIETTGEIYKVDISLSSIDENPSKKDSSKVSDHIKIGENIYYTEYTTQIEEQLEKNDGEIQLNAGDYLNVTVENVSRTLYQEFKNFLYNNIDDKVQISGQYGGMILEETGVEQATYADEAEKYRIMYYKGTDDEVRNMPKMTYHNKGTKAKIESVSNIIRLGYDCLGWGFNRDQQKPDYSGGKEIFAEQDTKLYAVWKKMENRIITYYPQAPIGEVTNMPDNASVVYNDDYVMPSNVPIRPHYSFLGWSIDANLNTPEYSKELIETGSYTLKRVREDKNLYAVWKVDTHMVRYYANTEDEVKNMPEEESADYGQEYQIASNQPTRDIYNFLGWSKNKEATEAEYQPNQTVIIEGDLTLHAIWKLKEYTIVFDGNGGISEINSVKEKHGTTIKLPSAHREGYTFLGWSVSNNATTVDSNMVAGSDYTITSDRTLYAIWKINKYTIAFDGNGGTTPGQMTETYGTIIKLPTSTRAGYTFKGWADDAKATTPKYTDEFKVTQNKILYAVWEINSYTVTFNGNGGKTPPPVNKNYNEIIELPVIDREGYTFKGWAEDPNATAPQYTDKFVIPSEDKTLYAVWQVNKYYFNLRGYLDSVSSESIAGFGTVDVYINGQKDATAVTDYYKELPYGTTYEIKNIQAQKGKSYEGVRIGTLSGTIESKDTIVELAFISLKYTVRFDANGGSTPTQQTTVDYGTIIGLPTPYRSGYIFRGWSTNRNASSGTRGNYTVTQNVTLYAIWGPTSYSTSRSSSGKINGGSAGSWSGYVDSGADYVVISWSCRIYSAWRDRCFYWYYGGNGSSSWTSATLNGSFGNSPSDSGSVRVYLNGGSYWSLSTSMSSAYGNGVGSNPIEYSVSAYLTFYY